MCDAQLVEGVSRESAFTADGITRDGPGDGFSFADLASAGGGYYARSGNDFLIGLSLTANSSPDGEQPAAAWK